MRRVNDRDQNMRALFAFLLAPIAFIVFEIMIGEPINYAQALLIGVSAAIWTEIGGRIRGKKADLGPD